MPRAQMTKEASSRIQSTQALNGRDMSSSGFAAHAQSAGDRHQNQMTGGGQGGAASKEGSTTGKK